MIEQQILLSPLFTFLWPALEQSVCCSVIRDDREEDNRIILSSAMDSMCSPDEYATVIKNMMHARFKLMTKAGDTFIGLSFTKQLISSPSSSSNVHDYIKLPSLD